MCRHDVDVLVDAHALRSRGLPLFALCSPDAIIPPVSGDICELLVTLRHVEPSVWRRVHVPAALTLGELHEALQIVLGWTDSHLHEFRVGEVSFGMANVENELFCVDEHAAPLGAVARTGSRFLYRYDFGDTWDHDIVVERVTHGREEGMLCVGGERACPPEDCGGPPGYERLLTVLANPKDEEHASMKQWLGRPFAPEKFNIEAVNKKLATLSKRLKRAKPGRAASVGRR